MDSALLAAASCVLVSVHLQQGHGISTGTASSILVSVIHRLRSVILDNPSPCHGAPARLKQAMPRHAQAARCTS